MEMNDPMNAHIVPKMRADQLSEYQKKLIVGIANCKTDSYRKRVGRLGKLSFCTDACKFEVLKESKDVSDELFECLYNIFFGVVKPSAKELEPKPLDIARLENEKQTKDDSAQTGETVSKMPDDQAPEADEPVEKAARKHREGKHYSKRMTDEETVELIKLYLAGENYQKLARKTGRSVKQVQQKIADCKRKPKYKEMFKMNAEKTKEQRQVQDEPKPETNTEQTAQRDELPKCFTACGKGFITTDGGLKLDEEPITVLLRQKIIEKGLVRFWGEISIVITPGRPAGMVVNVEE